MCAYEVFILYKVKPGFGKKTNGIFASFHHYLLIIRNKEGKIMMPDYELAVNYVRGGDFDDLFTLMLRTKDDMLGKEIQLFLYAFYYDALHKEIINAHDALLLYIAHASGPTLREVYY